MRFRVLGPVEAWNEKGRIDVRGSKLRTVLASLLLSRGRVVSDSRLIEMLWGEEPPSTTHAQIQTYASRLRSLLAPDVRIERQPPGYRLSFSPDQRLDLDLLEFERLAAAGRAALAGGQAVTARRALGAALAQWRGQALAGVTDHLASIEQAHLEEARLAVLESRIEADLVLGEHAALITELTALVAAYNLRERPRLQLMLAFHRCGRTADALTVYQEFRQILIDELGLDPSAELQRLHRLILAGDPILLPRSEPVRLRSEHVRSVLPAEPSDFVGREAEAAQVCAPLTIQEADGGLPDVCVITGMGGVGKTTLALRVARRLREHHTDRQIRVDLGGSRSCPPGPETILTRLLGRLGVAEEAVPNDLADLVSLYRNTVIGTRTLILLDDATDAQQVRPLLPGVAGCRVLVTSRRHLAALEGVTRVAVDVFTSDESVELLARIAGRARVAAEERTARRIAELCGHLPLAIRVSGARLAARPHWPLSRLADRLLNSENLLDELRLADLDVGVGLEASYRSLPSHVRCGLLELSELEEPSFSARTAAELLGLSLRDVQDLIDELVEAHLLTIDVAVTDHYRLSNLVRALASQQIRTRKLLESLDTIIPAAAGCVAGPLPGRRRRSAGVIA